MKLGVHISISGTIDLAVDRALERNCDTFQLFTRNPRGWRFKDLLSDSVTAFKQKLNDSGINPVIGHMPYLPNLSSPIDTVYYESITTLKAELKRCGQLGIPYLVTHVGSHLGMGVDVGLARIASALNEAFSAVENDVLLLLEDTSGWQNSMGTTFEDIRNIIDRVDKEQRVGVCLDTCHAFAAGYDLRSDKAVSETMKQLDKYIGLKKLKVIHLNDSKGCLCSRIDRHDHIGLGQIGEKGFRAILKQKVIRELPLILETPTDWRRNDYGNIEKVRELEKIR